MHAIMRKNFGCITLQSAEITQEWEIITDPTPRRNHSRNFRCLGIQAVFFREFFYCNKCAGIANEKICPHSESDRLTFSGTKLRKMFQSGETPPKEFMRPEVSEVILKSKTPFVE